MARVTEFFWITPGAATSILAKNRATPILSAPMAASWTTTSFTARIPSRLWKISPRWWAARLCRRSGRWDFSNAVTVIIRRRGCEKSLAISANEKFPPMFERADKTMPLDTVHRLDGQPSQSHRAIHNVFGMENARATYEGLRRLQGDERPFVLTRAAYAGAQRYAASWTGDNSSTWNHLRMSIPNLLNLGISGYPLVGDDIGGFNGSPTAELLTRWLELDAFNPIYRDHTMKGSADQEPWVHGPEK